MEHTDPSVQKILASTSAPPLSAYLRFQCEQHIPPRYPAPPAESADMVFVSKCHEVSIPKSDNKVCLRCQSQKPGRFYQMTSHHQRPTHAGGGSTPFILQSLAHAAYARHAFLVQESRSLMTSSYQGAIMTR